MFHTRVLSALLVCASIPSIVAAQYSISLRSQAEEAAWQNINRRLDSVVSFRFSETPLQEAAQEMLDKTGISFVIDQRALEDFGIDQTSPVSLDLKNVTARAFLTTMLQELELTWMIHNELLQITTPEQAEAHLVTLIYPVRDLIQAGRHFAPEHDDYDSLIELIESTIAPASWDSVGGPGAIESFANIRGIVVSQTTDVHHDIDSLIGALRRARRRLGLPVLELRPPRHQQVKPTPTAEQTQKRSSAPSRPHASLYGVAQGS